MNDDTPEMDELVRALTLACREADEHFQRVGGSTRHWVRDCFLPMLDKHHLAVTSGAGVVPCQFCRVDLKPADWMDRETGLSCAKGPNKGKPHQPAETDVAALHASAPPRVTEG